MTGRSRGQLVLAAAAVAAIAFVPVLFAYLQFGYAGDIHSDAHHATPGRDARHVLDRAVDRADPTLPGGYTWGQRRLAVSSFRRAVRDQAAGLDTPPDAGDGPVFTLTWNESAASTWAHEDCPSGRGRQFGACRADRGVVVQNRGGRTHAVAAALDVSVATRHGHASFTFLLRRR